MDLYFSPFLVNIFHYFVFDTGEIHENNKDLGGLRRQKQDAIFVDFSHQGEI